MPDLKEINPRKVAVDLDRTLILGGTDGKEVVLRPGAIFLLKSLLELEYVLALYTHASERGLITALDSVLGLEDYFDQIYYEKDEQARYSLKDPRIVGAKFLIDDVEPIVRHVNNLDLVGILVPEYVNPNDQSEEWAHEALRQIQSFR